MDITKSIVCYLNWKHHTNVGLAHLQCWCVSGCCSSKVQLWSVPLDLNIYNKTIGTAACPGSLLLDTSLSTSSAMHEKYLNTYKNIWTLAKIFEPKQSYWAPAVWTLFKLGHQSNPVTVSDKRKPLSVFENKKSKLQKNSEASCEIFKMGKFFFHIL